MNVMHQKSQIENTSRINLKIEQTDGSENTIGFVEVIKLSNQFINNCQCVCSDNNLTQNRTELPSSSD